jgi:quinol monooxygenase YgiN
LRETLLGLLAPTRAEAGCVNYDLMQRRRHLDAHGQTSHIQNLLARMNEFCVEPLKLDFWEKIG